MYYYTIITIEGHENTFPRHVLTEDEAAILGQLIELDGRCGATVILGLEEIRNGSGRVVGEHLTIAEDAWEVVREQTINATT